MKSILLIRAGLLLVILAMVVPEHLVLGQVEAGEHSVSINDMEMYFEVYGEGEPVVLLHGFFGSSKMWEPLRDELASAFQLIIPDLRGHGKSTNPGKEFTHRQSAKDVYALLDHLEIDRFKAMGVSTGGMTLLHMATQQDDRLESMVLIGATVYFPDEARAVMEQTTFEKRNDPMWSWLNDYHSRGDDQIEMLFNQFHGFKDSYDDMNFTSPLLSTIETQTLVVHGDRDIFFPVNIPVEMYRAIPNSYLWIVPNGGHVPIFDEMLPKFLQTATAFLSNDWGEPFMGEE